MIRLSLYDDSDLPYDPANLSFRVSVNGGAETVYEYGTDAEVEREEEGIYELILLADQPGKWRWRAEITGTISLAVEGAYEVARSVFSL